MGILKLLPGRLEEDLSCNEHLRQPIALPLLPAIANTCRYAVLFIHINILLESFLFGSPRPMRYSL